MKKYQILGGVILLIAGLIAGSQLLNRTQKTHVFINTTDDHRFDESIKVSILSAYLRTKTQNAVVILDRLPEGSDLSKVSVSIFEKLKLGRTTKGRAILYVFIPAQKLLKIEVGYALEAVLPDVVVRRFEEAAKTFIYANRLNDFWAELINTINIRIAQNKDALNDDDHTSDWKYVSGGAGISSSSYNNSLSELEKEVRRDGEDSRQFLASKDPQETVNRYLGSLGEGLGDRGLSLLSEGSRLFRTFTPMTVAQLKRNFDMYNRALPFEMHRTGHLSVAVFKKQEPVLPIVLIKGRDDLWFIDEPKSWAYFHRFEDSMEIFQKFPGYPFEEQLNGLRLLYKGSAPAKIFLKANEEFWAVGRNLEKDANSSNSQSLFDLADFFYFEAYDIERAYALYTKGLDLAPERFDYHWRMLDLQINLGHVSEYLKNMARLAAQFPKDRELQRNNDFYQKQLLFPPDEWETSPKSIQQN